MLLAFIIFNAVLVALVFGGILALLSWGIRSDRAVATTLTARRRAVVRERRRATAPRFAPAYHQGA